MVLNIGDYSGGGGKRTARPPVANSLYATLANMQPSHNLNIGDPEIMQLLAEAAEASEGGIKGGYEGFLQQGGNTLSPFRSAPETMDVAPQVTFRPKPRPPVNTMDPLDAILQKMLSDSAASSFDYEETLRQSEDAIRDAYAKEIHAIRGNNKQARRETRAEREEIESLYNQLAKTFEGDSRRARESGRRSGETQTKVFQKAATDVQGRYEDSAGFLAETLKGLGVESAAKDLGIFNEGRDDATRAVERLVNEGAEESARERRLGSSQGRLMQGRAGSARYEGVDRSADMLHALQDYVRSNLDQIASLKGAREKEIMGNEQSVMQSFAEMEQESRDQLYGHLLDYAGLRANIDDDIADNKRADQQLLINAQGEQPGGMSLPDFMKAPAQIAAQPQFKRQGVSDDMMNVFNSFAKTPALTAPYAEKMNPYQAADLIVKIAKDSGIQDIQVLNALRQMAMLGVDY